MALSAPSGSAGAVEETFMVRFAVLALLIASLAGCGQVVVFGHVVREGSAVKAAAAPAPDTPAAATTASTTAESLPHIAHAVEAVSLVVTPEASAKATGDASRFSAAALLEAIETELRSRKLLGGQDVHASGTAEVVVDRLAMRPTSNAILFGYKMLAGTLQGDIRVTGTSDLDPTGSRIVAESRLTVSASGEDENPLGPLYREFAARAADRLVAIASKPATSAGNPHY